MSFRGSLTTQFMSSQTLLQKISTFKALKQAWDALDKINLYSQGLSGVTIEQFATNLENNLKEISKQLSSNNYTFKKNRAVAYRKSDKKSFRPLQIPEITDRVLIKTLAIELELQFNELIKQSEGFSFAYQKKTGIQEATLKLKSYYSDGYKFALKADIVEFFTSVDRNTLLNEVIFKKLPDNSLNKLIEASLNIELGGLDKLSKEQKSCFKNIGEGIPQGNALSPLLSNIYLAPFDKHLISKGYKLVRYADDFVILCKTKQECIDVFVEVKSKLNEIGLNIHDLQINEKTQIIEVGKQLLTFLSITHDGKSIFPSKSNFERFIDKIIKICSVEKESDLYGVLTRLKNAHDGWLSAFIYTDVDKYLPDLDFYINRNLLLAIEKLGFKIHKNNLAELPNKYWNARQSKTCLTNNQRLKLGIKLSQNLLDEKRRNQKNKKLKNIQLNNRKNFN